MPEVFRLVVCDGPPEETPGGRYGLLPVMGARLGAGTSILLHDAGRESERGAVRRWQEQRDLSVELRDTAGRVFAVVTCR
jgi:hypothetical protein